MEIKRILKRYSPTIAVLAAFVAFILIFPEKAPATGKSLLSQVKTILLIIPPVFILLGLLDVWVPRDMMMKLMGPGTGIKGFSLAFLLGSAAAGPLYGAFPVAAVLMKKGAGFFNILVFLGAWSTTKIPMLLFEIRSLGFRFALSRLVIDIVGISIIAFLLVKLIPRHEVKRLYDNARL